MFQSLVVCRFSKKCLILGFLLTSGRDRIAFQTLPNVPWNPILNRYFFNVLKVKIIFCKLKWITNCFCKLFTQLIFPVYCNNLVRPPELCLNISTFWHDSWYFHCKFLKWIENMIEFQIQNVVIIVCRSMIEIAIKI